MVKVKLNVVTLILIIKNNDNDDHTEQLNCQL